MLIREYNDPHVMARNAVMRVMIWPLYCIIKSLEAGMKLYEVIFCLYYVMMFLNFFRQFFHSPLPSQPLDVSVRLSLELVLDTSLVFAMSAYYPPSFNQNYYPTDSQSPNQPAISPSPPQPISDNTRKCSVRGCSLPIPSHTANKMCETCRGRHRIYATTKRARRKLEKAAMEGFSSANSDSWISPATPATTATPQGSANAVPNHQLSVPGENHMSTSPEASPPFFHYSRALLGRRDGCYLTSRDCPSFPSYAFE